MSTKIEWTEATWNPVRGCARVSPGCEHCYAERMARRHDYPGGAYEGLTVLGKKGPRWNGTVRLVPAKLGDPLRWRKPKRVFVNSMSDLFHEDIPNEYIAAVFGVMAACPQHTFQVLTKRAQRMRDWFEWIRDRWAKTMNDCPAVEAVVCAETLGVDVADRWHKAEWPLQNVWLGVSVEDQQRADERILLLRECPAAVHWVSAEPLLGPVDLGSHLWPMCGWWKSPHNSYSEAKASGAECGMRRQSLIGADSRILRWVVVGGESGPGARPLHTDWVRSLVRQCEETGTSIFVKQLGADPRTDHCAEDGAAPQAGGRIILASRKGGDPSEWPEDLRVRQYPEPRP